MERRLVMSVISRFHRAGLLRSALRTFLQRRPSLVVTLRCRAGKPEQSSGAATRGSASCYLWSCGTPQPSTSPGAALADISKYICTQSVGNWRGT